MQISGISNSAQNTSQGVTRQQSEDQIIKNAQAQIEALRKQIQELAENKELDPKVKSEKKQELQKQITELNTQIRQRQAELRKEKSQPTEQSQKKQAEKEAKAENKPGGAISRRGFNTLLSADNAVSLSNVHGSVASSLEGRAKELSSEIKQDGGRGAVTEQKQNELAEISSHAKKARNAQAETLGEANKNMKKSAEIENEADKKADKDKSREEEIKVDGIYDKDGNRIERNDPGDNRSYEDKA